MNFTINVKIEELRKKGYGYKKIASSLDMSPNTVKSYLRRRSLAENAIIKCQFCGVGVRQNPHRKTKKFCSDKCRMAWWNAHPEQVEYGGVD